MRLTRAAQRAQQDTEETVEAPEVNERILKDIEPNNSPLAQSEEPLPAKTPAKTPAKKGKGKGAKKGAKGKKAKNEEGEAAEVVEESEQQADADVDPANEDADLDSAKKQMNDAVEPPTNNEEPKAPQTPAVRLTRRQLAKLEEEEALSKSQRAPSPLQLEGNETEDAREDQAELVIKETIPEVKEDATTKEDSDEVEIPIMQEPAAVEAKSVPKPVRLTRRQQAKLEKESKQSQAEQQLPQPETTEEKIVEEPDSETQPEAVAEQVGESGEPAHHEAENIELEVASIVATGEQSSVHENIVAEPERIAETVAPGESQDVNIHTSEAPEIEDIASESVEAGPTTRAEDRVEAKLDAQFIDPLPEDTVPSVENLSEVEPKMLSAEKPFDGSVATPVKSLELARRISHSPSKSPMRIEESISAIDRLEEDLEDIGKAIPDLNHSEDEKSPRKPRSGKAAAAPIARGKTPSKTPAKTPEKTPAMAASKTSSKTPIEPPVVAKGLAAAKAPPPRISRVPNTAPKSVKPTTTSLARASSVRTAPSNAVAKPSTDTADYLASKRRPISLSYPTPPPPPKGKAPTKSTFQLSSDNVAAKLKAQKQERLKREAEGAAAPKQRPISMPPPPKSTKPPTVPSFQLPGEATAARLKAQKEERLKRMEEAGAAAKPSTRPISMPPPPKSTKPPTKPSFQLPGEATAARLKAQKEERLKRMEEAEAAKKAALAAPVRKPIAHRPRESLLARDAPGINILPPSNTDAPQRSTSLASKRSSMVGPSASRSTSTSSANRNSLLLTSGAKSTVTPVDAVALKIKGKEVFNRDRMEKEAMERERKEKEEAAKKARAEAAERGRIASREWAERQRKKMMGQ